MPIVQSEGSLLNAAPPWSPRFSVGSVAFPSGLVQDYAAIFRTQPNLRLVVRFLARNIAQLRIRAGRRIDEATVAPLDRKHELSRLLRRPNTRTTRHRFVDSLMHDLGIYDRFYAPILRNEATNAPRLFRIPPQNMRPTITEGSWLFPDKFETVGLRERREYEHGEVFYLHGHDPEDPRGGLSPIEAIRRILIEDLEATTYRAQMWRNAARKSGIIERPIAAPDWSDQARNRFKEDFSSRFTGAGPEAGGTPVLEEGMTWVDTSFTPKDAEYLGARRLSREEVAAQYHVSPLFVGILEHANFSNVSEQHRHLYTDTLGPWLDMIEEDLELQLLPFFPDLDPDEIEIRFDLDEKLRGSFEEEAKILQTATGAPWMLRDEARARRGLAPLPNGQGEQIVTPLNVLIGGQASPTDSAPEQGLAGNGNPVRATTASTKTVPARRKSVDDLPNDVVGWHAKHVEVLSSFFGRQGQSVKSKVGAGQEIEAAFDADRWNGELTTDLAALAFTMSEEVAGATAVEWGGEYDPALAEAWLAENARIAAENVNAGTLAALVDGADDADDLVEFVAAIFATAAASRTEEIATTRTTSVSNFARKEGAEQAGATHKVWHVNSTESRHPTMNGERVAIGEKFSNGLLWPGDPAGSVDDTAGCVCSLGFEA